MQIRMIYGTTVNRVSCLRERQTGTQIKSVSCRFKDEEYYRTFGQSYALFGVNGLSSY